MARMKQDPNFSFMLAGMLFTLVIGPVLLEFGVYEPGLTIQAALTITLIVGIWSIVDSRVWFWIGVVLAVGAAGFSIAEFLRPSFYTNALGLVTIALFCFFSIAFTFDQIAESGSMKITPNRLIGAVSVYLLIGVGFGVVNMALEVFLPGSFKGLDPAGEGSVGLDLIYYSFVTMTTLGYGDVTPIRPLAQATAYMGAVAGQFYIAVLVAGLVGGYVSQRLMEREQNDAD